MNDERKNVLDGLTELEIKIVEALATKGEKTYTQVAEEIGISRRTLQRYRKKPYIMEAVRQLAMEELEAEIPSVLSALAREAKKGKNMKATELFVKLAGLYKESYEINQTTTVNNRYHNLSDDELNEELEAIERELKVIKGGKGKAANEL